MIDQRIIYFRIKEAAEIFEGVTNTLQKRVARGKSLLVAIQPTETGNTNVEA
jgi:hypothetical protein